MNVVIFLTSGEHFGEAHADVFNPSAYSKAQGRFDLLMNRLNEKYAGLANTHITYVCEGSDILYYVIQNGKTLAYMSLSERKLLD